ncbi:MAG: photosystem II assembly protein Psb34 [Brasilonema sp.]
MLDTTDDKGILNSYAVEPAIYLAEYPTLEEQQALCFRWSASGFVGFRNIVHDICCQLD